MKPGPSDLRLAICRRDLAAVRSLLEAGADPSLAHCRRTPLSWAQQNGQVDIVAALLAAGADANGRSCDALERVEPPLVTAVRLGQDAIFAELVAAGADLSGEDFYGHTPLWTAVWHRRLWMAFQLVGAGARVTSGDAGWQGCPLYLAARQPCPGWRRLALLLALLGAAPNLPDAEGRSALWWALRERDDHLARALIACGAKLAPNCPSLQEALCGADETILAQLRAPQSPPPLTHLCRTMLRRSMGVTGRALPAKLARLPLPDALVAFLQLREFSDPGVGVQRVPELSGEGEWPGVGEM